MTEIYVIGGSEWLAQNLNAIAAFMQTDTWDWIRNFAVAISVLVLAVRYTARRDLMDILGWVFVLVFSSALLTKAQPVQIIDLSNQRSIQRVANVPLGIVLPATVITRIGYAMVLGYEMVFSQPDAVTYSKTGMLFGSSLVAKSTDFTSRNPELSDLFSDYVQNCVVGDILLNRKYSFDELMNSPDPYTLIFSRPSPLRGVFNKDGRFQTCEEVAGPLKNLLVHDTSNTGQTFLYYASRLFGSRPDSNQLFAQLLGNSYQYFYQNQKTASDIIKQNIVMNGLRSGIMSYSARSGDTAGMLNIASTSAIEKQRLSQATLGQVMMRSLPLLQVILIGMMMGMFPILVIVGMVNQGKEVAKYYVFGWLWVMSWPLLYAILNSAMAFYGQKAGSPVVLSNLSTVKLNYSDLANTAGYISSMIPFISWYIAKGLGQGLMSVSHSMTGAYQSSASSAAMSVSDANYSFNNMQTDNVQGNTWDTNSSVRAGQMTKQLSTGGSQTQTADGSQVFDSTGSTSKLPVDIGVTKQIATAQQEMAREAETQAQTSMQGFNSNISSGWTQLSQFTGQRGSSDSMTHGADTAQNSQSSIAAHKMASAVESYANANNVSKEQATSELASRSMDVSGGGEVRGGVRGSYGLKVLGNGVTAEGYAGLSAGFKGTDHDAHSASSGTRSSQDARHDQSAQAAADFKEGMEYLTSQRTSQSGSHTDNNADSRIDQLSSSLSGAKSSYEQYSSAHTRSQELSQQASRTESLSGDMRENLSQQFAQYVMDKAPNDAGNILTGQSQDAVAARQSLARDFVREQVAPQVDAQYQSSSSSLGAGMGSVGGGGSGQDIQADYQNHQNAVENRTSQAGIRNDVGTQVNGMVDNNQTVQQKAQSDIHSQQQNVEGQRNELQQHHSSERTAQNKTYTLEKGRQEGIPGASSQDEMMEKAKVMQDKFNKERGGK
ncbi:conjugal transfer mating pair stabilization protein TraG [Serratia marcescens]|uniref:conjugal transfer mating-pair stabilization protein TraG n=1 Tax=Serratia TaxID=613 RepID=UPI0011F307C2|nr:MULTISPECIES: conjugal transfer mating-pair stabilization protein TraG [Serratia]MBH2524374.1 conjugal transfer mating pair stabilization protein TraG [Serratia marcescens]MBH2909096.1 conjugal transfer mating pair stabilization protein TraG [Serratia marcescens]MBH2913710.1 conjugal transfer mating pair stabilization protein TraG [Serratia marcescens]CAI1913751.1 conjugal transfer mating pair stabilization protein TraG [Serratia marcescens]HEJ9119337.1 conjugal transfer mating pair stabili